MQSASDKVIQKREQLQCLEEGYSPDKGKGAMTMKTRRKKEMGLPVGWRRSLAQMTSL